MKKTNIAIDGTSGSGKSTIARLLSKVLLYYYLDTGAIYRLIAYKAIEDKLDLKDEKAISVLLKKIELEIDFNSDKNGEKNQINILDGKKLDKVIRTEKVSFSSSIVAQHQCVHDYIKKIILNLTKKYNIIVEGRDIGTFVLPKANFKFFITAQPEERARRRINQLKLPQTEYKKVLEEIKNRDKRDIERAVAPLQIAKDAYVIDNTNQTPDETVKEMLKIIRK
ncbi:MAG: (d)CMP kinase [Clostridia bacterium]|nr:(d)CMP kinase [Clostridia bacterium]